MDDPQGADCGADNGKGPWPAGPDLGRPSVVSVRLSAEEHARLQRAAEAASLPLSTLIGLWALDRLRALGRGERAQRAERLTRLERAVFQRSA